MSQPLPVCNFLCGTSGDYLEYCQTVCKAKANCPLTANILYTFADGLFNDGNFFVTGTGSVVSNQFEPLIFRIAIYQQLPWILGFMVILAILVYADIIYTSSALMLAIGAIVIAGFAVYLTLADGSSTISNTIVQVQSQLEADYNNARSEVGEGLYGPLLQAIAAATLPCNTSS